ncbi:protein kinase domain-containing protein [Krasilnikovia sp. MM14-A1004]|uniref:serine/threonine-protein kinase n=1 Tax=Krasilnikovia sp. MM14-A1004 TaxID=3373541 RepID=UPI00399CFEE8
MTRDPASGAASAAADGPSALDLSGRCVGGSYLLVEPIGQGATGQVWRGVDRATGAPVAVKVLYEGLLHQPKLVSRFVQERTILLMLRHPNVVRVRDLFSVGETLALVMDLVPGGSLRDHLREHRTVAPAEAARLTAQVAGALAEAHELGVVHRDLKPDNILLESEDGRLRTRLTDFGIARMLTTPSLTMPHAVVGTPHYMAPESFQKVPATPAADVYALGVLLYELLTGHPPYEGDSVPELMRQHLAGQPVRRPGIPDPLWEVIRDCLQPDARLRPTAAGLVAELRLLPHPPGRVVPGHPLEAQSPAGATRRILDPAGRADAAAFVPPGSAGATRILDPAGRADPTAFVAPDSAGATRIVDPAGRVDSTSPAGSGLSAASAGSAALPPRSGGSGRSGRSSRSGRAGHPDPAGERRWARPLVAVVLVVGGVMVAAGAATTASRLGRTDGAIADTELAGPDVVLPARSRSITSAPGHLSVSHSTADVTSPRSLSGHPPRRQVEAAVTRTVPSPTARSRGPAPAGPPSRPPTRTPGGTPYGPPQCRQDVRSTDSGPIVVQACFALGADVKVQADLTAPAGGRAGMVVFLVDVDAGRPAGVARDCRRVRDADPGIRRTCGPTALNPPRGHRYQLVVSWQYRTRGTGEVSGRSVSDVFTW